MGRGGSAARRFPAAGPPRARPPAPLAPCAAGQPGALWPPVAPAPCDSVPYLVFPPENFWVEITVCVKAALGSEEDEEEEKAKFVGEERLLVFPKSHPLSHHFSED